MSSIVGGIISGLIMALVLTLLIGGRDMLTDFDGFISRHGKGILWTFIICAILGILIGLEGGNSGASCREWGRFASSC